METRLVVALVVVLAAVVAARLIERRRPDAPARGTYPVPAQLDRDDFPGRETPVLVVLFSSVTCDNCALMAERVAALARPGVATCDIEVGVRPDLHRRYGVEGVPMVVVSDAEGVVQGGFVGATHSADLEAAVSRARGS